MIPIDAVLITCEHGGNRVPPAYRAHFRGHERLLASHRGWDPGTLATARFLARTLRAPLLAATVTRLLVDLNRSPGHPRVFSAVTRKLPAAERETILERHYRPHREAVARAAAAKVSDGGTLLHLAVHSFTPVLDGAVRQADLGLLYDPSRPREAQFCAAWKEALAGRGAPWRVRRNYPYLGIADGLTTALRLRLGPRYLGIELEMNQRFFLAGSAAADARRLRADLAETLAGLLSPGTRRRGADSPRSR